MASAPRSLPEASRVAERKDVPGKPLPQPGTMMSAEQLGAVLTDPAKKYADHVNGKTSEDDGEKLGETLLQMAKEADRASRTYYEQNVRSAWDRSYKAFRNEHAGNSKYRSREWAGRSKVYRPKTRTMVKKAKQVAAQALFATNNVVNIGAGNEADPRQRASAAIKLQLLNYRTTRQNEQASIPWFLVSMGACEDSVISGVCVSKQYWLRRVRMEERMEEVPVVGRDPYTMEDVPQSNEDGTPMTETQKVTVEVIEEDRPEIQLFPPENVRIDPTAPWTSPIQGGAYVQLSTPMKVDDVVDMMEQEQSEYLDIEWYQLDRAEIEKYCESDAERESIRRAREGGNDRIRDAQAVAHGHWSIVWVTENFIRWKGTDYHFYSLGTSKIISKPTPVQKVYPWYNGQRPIAYGYGEIEAHRITPMSKVEAMMPLQQEANDIANLRLDQMKNVVMPLAIVRRGQDFDTEALKKRGPNATIFTKNPKEDLVWDRPTDVPASAYQETNLLNADMDDLNGTFSGASVSTNREMNETVGGMNLLSGSANAATEFDLRVWVETWVEVALAQVLKLIEYYESDENILALAGARAKLMQQFNVNEIDDDLLNRSVTCTVNAGIGASDPMQKLQKFKMASETAGQVIAPGVQSGEVKVNYKEVVDECFGAAGYSDAGERFITVVPPEDKGPPPEVQVKQMEIEAEKERYQMEIASKERIEEANRKSAEAMHAAELANKVQLEEIKAQNEIAGETTKMLLQGLIQDDAAAQQHGRVLEIEDKRGAHGLAQLDKKGEQANRQLAAKGEQQLMLGDAKAKAGMDQLTAKGEQGMAQLDAKGQQAELSDKRKIGGQLFGQMMGGRQEMGKIDRQGQIAERASMQSRDHEKEMLDLQGQQAEQGDLRGAAIADRQGQAQAAVAAGKPYPKLPALQPAGGGRPASTKSSLDQLAVFAEQTMPMMSQMFEAMQQMQKQFTGGVTIHKDPVTGEVTHFERGGTNFNVQRGEDGEIGGFAEGPPPMPPGGMPGEMPPQAQLPPPEMPPGGMPPG